VGLRVTNCHALRMADDSIQKRFGGQVRTLRKLQNLSQEELSHKCSLDRTYISGIERGVRNPTLAIIETIANALGISLSDLFRL